MRRRRRKRRRRRGRRRRRRRKKRRRRGMRRHRRRRLRNRRKRRRIRIIIRVIIIVCVVSIIQYSTEMETIHCSLSRQVLTVYLFQICTKPECDYSCKLVSQDASPTCDLNGDFGIRTYEGSMRFIAYPRDSTPHEVAPGIATMFMRS